MEQQAFRPIAHPSTELNEIIRAQSKLYFPHFNSADIWAIGVLLRERLLPSPVPVVISILVPGVSQPRTVFHTITHAGTAPDNDSWVARKARTVLRFGVPTWQMHVKFQGDEKAFAAKYGMGPEQSGAYAIHGGAVPVRVSGVEGVVGVVIVSGLKQHEDHGVVMEVLDEFLNGL